MYEPYSQEDHDRAVEVGCLALVIGLIVAVVVIVAIAACAVSNGTLTKKNDERVMDGSNAGANAVTFDDLEREGLYVK